MQAMIQIRMPSDLPRGYDTKPIKLRDEFGALLWSGCPGETATFRASAPLTVFIYFGPLARELYARVTPGSVYTVTPAPTQDYLPAYRLV